MSITRVRFSSPVGMYGGPRQYEYAGPHARYSQDSKRGAGIEIWESDNKMVFVPMSNIAYIEETT